MFTATSDLVLPAATTGFFPRLRWYDVSAWGATGRLHARHGFREKFLDALSVMISDQECAASTSSRTVPRLFARRLQPLECGKDSMS